MNYETLIFDLDGTISDPFVGISRSVNYALTSFGYESVTPSMIKPMIGPPLTEIFTHFLGDLPDDRLHSLIDKYRERYTVTGFRENTMYDNMANLISMLATDGYRLGVCTAKRADYALSIVKYFDLDMHFDFVDGGGVGVHKTEQLARIVEAGVNPAKAVMIGDRAGDIVAAKDNGVTSVGVLWGFGDREELASAVPDFVAETPQDLRALFI